jgi:hypothetical protein
MGRAPGITLRQMNSFAGKHLLALVRGGDYAHAGEEEAIELAFSAVPKDPRQSFLMSDAAAVEPSLSCGVTDGVKSPRESIGTAIR